MGKHSQNARPKGSHANQNGHYQCGGALSRDGGGAGPVRTAGDCAAELQGYGLQVAGDAQAGEVGD